MLAPVRTADPAETPVTLDEAKLHLRVDHNDDDTLISSLIGAATAYLDGWSGILGRALVTQTWRQDFCRFSDCMRLPLAPVTSIDKVEYFDGANARQTLDAGVYTLLADARSPFVTLAPGQYWPGIYSRDDAVSVTFVAGCAAEAVPAPIRTAILLHVAHLYINREAVIVGDAPTVLPMSAEALIAPYRRVGV